MMLYVMEQSSKKFKIVTLGCRTNQYEGHGYTNQLEALGYSPVQEGEEAELCIVNTCTVTQSADAHSRQAINKLHRENPKAKIVVTGCYVENNRETVTKLPGVLKVVPNLKKEDLVSDLFPDLEVPEFAIKHFASNTRAFVKVQDGCNSFCTYCVIPYVRGRSRSRTIEEVVRECSDLIANGFKEIVLTGINIGDFDGAKDSNQKDTLADLIRACDALPGLERLRVSSIDPDEVDEDLQDAILNGRKTCPSMHIVLQSGSNVILKRMNRKYTRQIFLETVERLTKAAPSFTFTTDIIIGFPGETEQDFQETLAVMEEVQFAKVHMFPYSDRPRTRSNLMPNKVDRETINSRKAHLLRLAEKQAYHLRQHFLQEEMTVLTESFDAHRSDGIFGHTENFLPVWIPHFKQSNQLVKVKLVENTPEGFIGSILS
ncbi:Threonylcarbamoyladenosine tRNA methylthiotransferase MtaB [Chlamydiales bacterium STE3]|nr:Threonylcarbamoyladenosine tRNA methylthiotransferase MtaB [Chlamydiales bacterium STE3]